MKISVIIPVFNESERINNVIGHICDIKRKHDIEIIVVDGDPLGSTANAVASGAAIKVFSEKGRGTQMNRGASIASGEILLFLHADTLLPDNAFERIASVMCDDIYAGGCFEIGIDSKKTAFRVIEIGASLRSRVTGIPYGDQAIFMRRDIFQELGGYKDFPIMEDVELMSRTRRAGHRIIMLPEKVKTSARRWIEEGIIYCTLRNWTLITLYSLGVSPHKLSRCYRSSRKVEIESGRQE